MKNTGHNNIIKELADTVEARLKRAEQGDASSQYFIGHCYYYGDGVIKDKTRAIKWFIQSAEQGYAKAQYYVGRCYFQGEVVEMDYAKAVTWWTKAAKSGHAAAMDHLARCYENGLGGCNIDMEAAEIWRNQARKDRLQKLFPTQDKERQAAKIPYLSYNEARDFVRSIGIKTGIEWNKYLKGELRGLPPKPSTIPANLASHYIGKGWMSWRNFLGTEK